MADLSIQFHALPEETLTLLRTFLEDAHVEVVTLLYPPFRSFHIPPDKVVETVATDASIREVALTQGPAVLDVAGMTQFVESNPGVLRLVLGRVTAEGLQESWLSARAEDKAALDMWRKLVALVRSITRAGAVAVDPVSGASSQLRSHRHTAGARDLASKGVDMLPAAGMSRIKFL